jgi:hypothetical protein
MKKTTPEMDLAFNALEALAPFGFSSVYVESFRGPKWMGEFGLMWARAKQDKSKVEREKHIWMLESRLADLF